MVRKQRQRGGKSRLGTR